MYIKVSKAMCKELNKNMKEASYCVSKIVYDEMSPQAYKSLVDSDLYSNEIDYNINTGRFKVLCVIYKDDCYCMDKYLTTRDLNRLFNDSDKSAEGFFNEVNNEIMI
jgi:hypothetical protein